MEQMREGLKPRSSHERTYIRYLARRKLIQAESVQEFRRFFWNQRDNDNFKYCIEVHGTRIS
jgi:hypothetical protein